MDCLVYSPQITPRISYTFRVLLEEFMGLRADLTDQQGIYQSFEGIKINYSKTVLTDREVFLLASGFLNDSDIRPPATEYKWKTGNLFLFDMIASHAAFDFYLHSYVFFMLCWS